MEMYVFAGDHMVADAHSHGDEGAVITVRGFGAEKAGHVRSGTQEANLRFIALARNSWPALLAIAEAHAELVRKAEAFDRVAKLSCDERFTEDLEGFATEVGDVLYAYMEAKRAAKEQP
jgi:hypothetical protein